MRPQGMPSDPHPPILHRARARIFGLPATPATLQVQPRPDSRRTLRTLLTLVATAVAAPVAFLVPPHAPWGVGALVGGLVLARRQWIHRNTILAVDAACPNCAGALDVPSGTRLRAPHPVACDGCHRDVSLHLEARLHD